MNKIKEISITTEQKDGEITSSYKLNGNSISKEDLIKELESHSFESYTVFTTSAKIGFLITSGLFLKVAYDIATTEMSWWSLVVSIVSLLISIGLTSQVDKIKVLVGDSDLNKDILAIFNSFKSSPPFYMFQRSPGLEKRTNAGTDTGMSTKDCPDSNNDYFEGANIFPCYKVGQDTFCFYPEFFLHIDEKGRVKSGGYVGDGSLTIRENPANTILIAPSKDTPKSAEVVGNIWEKVNNDGSPDRRFADNDLLNKVRYYELIISENNAEEKARFCVYEKTQAAYLINGFTQSIFQEDTVTYLEEECDETDDFLPDASGEKLTKKQLLSSLKETSENPNPMDSSTPWSEQNSGENLVRHLTEAGLVDVKLSGDVYGFMAHFDLLKTDSTRSGRKKIAEKAMELMYGRDLEIIDDAYYFNYPNNKKSYGILAIDFEEFKGSRSGTHYEMYKYLQNRGTVVTQIKKLEPEMKTDPYYIFPRDVDYS